MPSASIWTSSLQVSGKNTYCLFLYILGGFLGQKDQGEDTA